MVNRTATFQDAFRALTAAEVSTLEAQSCRCENWRQVQVTEHFDPARYFNVRLSGYNALGSCPGSVRLPGGLEHPCGVYNAALHDCHVGHNVLIRNVGRHIAGYTIEDDVVIDHVDLIAVEGETTFGNGTRVSALNEAGGREVLIYDRLNSHVAYLLAMYRHQSELIGRLESMIESYVDGVRSARGLIGRGAQLVNCGTLVNVKIGPAAFIAGATRLTFGSINSNSQAPAKVGDGVIAQHFILSSGSTIDSGAIVSHTFLGQGVRVGRQFTAEHCIVLANSELMQGEAASVLAGPYSVSHHKSSLLIAGLFSFYNAGSGTNQSNHMYKMGPVHQGVLERGCKTGSSSYLLWSSRVGAFTSIIGRHGRQIDTSSFPFSYVLEQGGRSVLIPGANICTVGTRRDIKKWPQRDRRSDPDQLDRLHFAALSPYTVGRMIPARDLLTHLDAKTPADQPFVQHSGASIPRGRLHKSACVYDMAVTLYLGEKIAARLEELLEEDVQAPVLPRLLMCGAEGRGTWVDLCGLLAPQSVVEDQIQQINRGVCSSLTQIESALEEIWTNYALWEWDWVVDAWLGQLGKTSDKVTSEDLATCLTAWKAATAQWANWIRRDAETEFKPAMTYGYGIDGGPGIAQQDFAAVRGPFDENPFVSELCDQTKDVFEQADRLARRIAA